MEKILPEKKEVGAGPRFGRYHLIRPLKRSPFLESFLAQEISPPHNIFVLKRLHPMVVHRADWVSLFLDEAARVASLSHPNITPIYEFGQIDGVPYFLNPFIFGKKIQTLLSRSRYLPIPTGMALLIVRQILLALDFARRPRFGRGVFHGGLHPERIFITYEGEVKVNDFGLGRLEDPRSPVRSHYLAPEQNYHQAEESPGADLYAVAVILCDLLGEPPEPVQASPGKRGYLSGPIQSLLDRGLAVDVKDRFQTTLEMLSAVEEIVLGEYAQLNLTNYIQAFFGKELELERRLFSKFNVASTEAGAPAPPISNPPLHAEPAPSPLEPSRPATSQSPSSSPPSFQGETVPPPARPVSSQKIWWGLFGLLSLCFVGVFLFSLFKTSLFLEKSAPPDPAPAPVPAPLPMPEAETPAAPPVVEEMEPATLPGAPPSEAAPSPLPDPT
ncbi:MAG TPA: hypothetical protein VI382_10605, partial [Candidatus Manganitrophaceae bacterium]|nr:hypothetical protein [Candidatus Manganitrophaceae bacterium]